jgi:hypothetical protein
LRKKAAPKGGSQGGIRALRVRCFDSAHVRDQPIELGLIFDDKFETVAVGDSIAHDGGDDRLFPAAEGTKGETDLLTDLQVSPNKSGSTFAAQVAAISLKAGAIGGDCCDEGLYFDASGSAAIGAARCD